MMIRDIALSVVEAFRIYLTFRFCKNCLGKCRTSKKMIYPWFAFFWLIGMLFKFLVTPKEFILVDMTVYFAEMVFLFLVSFAFCATIVKRFFIALIFPNLYWIGKWTVLYVIYGTIAVEGYQYLIGTLISTLGYALLEVLLERIQKSRYEYEREILEQEISIYENQFQIIRQSQKNVSSLKHDMKHHLKMLADMITKNENQAALLYLESMGTFMGNTKEYVSSGNERMDSILNFMIEKAKEKDIAVKWKIQIPEQLSMDIFDMNVILNNLFDNAFHALEGISRPELYLLMKYDRGILCIHIQNNFVDSKSKRIEIEKSSQHGYGLHNIRRIVEKYNGEFTTKKENEIFDAMILLYLSNSNEETVRDY